MSKLRTKQNQECNHGVQHEAAVRALAVAVWNTLVDGGDLDALNIPESMQRNRVFLVLDFPVLRRGTGPNSRGWTAEVAWLDGRIRDVILASFGPFVSVAVNLRIVAVDPPIFPLAIRSACVPELKQRVDAFEDAWFDIVLAATGGELVDEFGAVVN
jgi:hypothetical protein